MPATVVVAVSLARPMPLPWLQSTFGTPLTSAMTLVTRIFRVAVGNGARMELPTVKMSVIWVEPICVDWATRSATTEAACAARRSAIIADA